MVTAVLMGPTKCWTIWRVRCAAWTSPAHCYSHSLPSHCSTCLLLPNTCRIMCPFLPALPACSPAWTMVPPHAGYCPAHEEDVHKPPPAARPLMVHPTATTATSIVRPSHAATVRKMSWTPGASPEHTVLAHVPGMICWPTTAGAHPDETIILLCLAVVRGAQLMMTTADVEVLEEVGEVAGPIIRPVTPSTSLERSR